ncbi:testis-specific serine/threonine-protein kinase 1-like isoform X1 [Hermetia illucens]|uniref:testis-specific serine/threonine-protein kinase 1-like isoform X1 n=2 Tax=Hermetia illucens TaxID=343691 RepID=UPI0018CC34B1|nr:testis-specific serine/threonine-protein kinase 1-like isoform X1 [Hermetia illucens]
MTKIPTSSEEKLLQEHGYKLIKKIGEGGYAKVFLGEFRSKNTEKVYPLACKVINTNGAPEKYTNKFLPREMKILVKINHPHIIHIHSIFQRNKIFFIFMRYAEKGDLLDFLLANGALKERQARIWVRQLALALQYLHTLEIAHRDIKCENVLVTNNYNVKLADFGFSRRVLDTDGRRLTSETFCGSLQYAPPEIIKGTPYHPKVADMWSFGVVMFTMLNKANPFNEKNHRTLHSLQVNKKWKFRSQVANNISPEAKDLVSNLLEPVATKRFSIDEVINSSWIAMDPKLKSLNAAEFAAISAAMEEAQGLQAEKAQMVRSVSFNLRNITKDKLKLHKAHLGTQNEFGLAKSEINKKDD